MYFRVQYAVAGMRFGLGPGESREFRYEVEPRVVVTLQNASDSGQPSPGKLTVLGEVTISGALEADAQRVQENPQAFKDQLESLQRESKVKEYLSRTVSVLRWRQGHKDGPLNPISNLIDEFSFDGHNWTYMPSHITLRIIWENDGLPYSKNAPDAAVCTEVVDLVTQGKEEPLGHQMLRDAWALRGISPRAALVIGFAAGEVGFKQLLAHRGESLPERTVWYNQIRKQLSRIGRLTIAGKQVGFSEPLVRKLEAAAVLRNNVVHNSGAAPTSGEVDTALKAVLDLLWFLDMFAAFTWAGDYISYEIRGHLTI